MVFAFPCHGVSVNARRYAHHDESRSYRAVCPAGYGISGPGCLSDVLRWPDLSRRSAMPSNSSRQIAIDTGKGAA